MTVHTGFAIFLMVFTAGIFVLGVLIGAHLSYCKQRELNPLRSGLFIGKEEPLLKKEETAKGFFG